KLGYPGCTDAGSVVGWYGPAGSFWITQAGARFAADVFHKVRVGLCEGAFAATSRAQVDALARQLDAAGVAIVDAPEEHADSARPRSMSASEPLEIPGGGSPRSSGVRSATSRTGPSPTTNAYSTALRSSRTFPGQVYSRIASIAVRVTPSMRRIPCWFSWLTKCQKSASTSPSRRRSGGSNNGTTLRR